MKWFKSVADIFFNFGKDLFHLLMKTFFAAFFTLIFLSSPSFSQNMSDDFRLTWADVPLHRSKDSKITDAFYKDGAYFVLRAERIRGPGGWYYFLEKYDEQLNRTEVKDISMNIDEENFITTGFEKMGDDYVILSFNFDKSRGKETYYIQLLDVDNMNVSKRQEIISFETEKKRRGFYMSFLSSDDDSFAMCYYTEYDRKTKVRTFNCFTFDDQMQLIWKMEDIDISEHSIREVFLDNEATVSLALSKYGDRRWFSRKEGEPRTVDFLLIDEDGVEEMKFEFMNYVPADVAITKASSGDYLLSGYYYKDEESFIVQGAYCTTINSRTGEEINDIHVEFSDDLLKEGESARTQKKQDRKKARGKDAGASSYDMMQVLEHDDGSFSLIGERNWIVVTTTTDANGNVQTRTTYHRSDMIITRIKNGEIIGNVKLNKHRSSGGPFVGYRAISHNNNTYIFFHDDRENLISIDPKSGVKSSNGKNKTKALSVFKISESGDQSRQGIIDYGDKTYEPYRTYWLGRDIRILDNKEILCWTYKGKKKFALLRISPK